MKKSDGDSYGICYYYRDGNTEMGVENVDILGYMKIGEVRIRVGEEDIYVGVFEVWDGAEFER